MTRETDLLAGVETAWTEFQHQLADRISQRAELDHILFELDVPERNENPTGPYVQVSWDEGDDLVVAEVSSNRALHQKFKLPKAARAQLRGTGWRRPDADQENYWYAFDSSLADQVSAMLVEALRGPLAVLHPAFLVDRFAEDIEAALVELEEQIPEPAPGLPETIDPADHEHLVELVDQALGRDWGRPTPIHDEDGDIPYVSGTAVVFVRVLEDAPVIRIFSELVIDVSDQDAAAFEVNVLNRDIGGHKFVLVGDRVKMSVDVPALPLVPYQLREMLRVTCKLAPELDSDLAHRVGGRPFLTESEDEAA